METSYRHISGTTSYQMPAGATTYAASNVSYAGPTHAEIATGSRMVTGNAERVQSTRKVSSTIINESYLSSYPRDMPTREVEVPGPVQEVIKHVPRKEIVETEKRVPRYEYEWVERILEVPRIEYIDKTVEIPKYQEVIREVKVPQVVDVPKEVIREVKVPKITYREEMREVPGPIIEVPKPYTVENKVEVQRYVDTKQPLIVAQTIKPYIVEGQGVVEVDVFEYEPECVPVDVHVVKAVQASIQAGGVIETKHRVVTVPAAQYNTMLQQLNVHLSQVELQKLPYMTESNGQVTFLGERLYYTTPEIGAVIQGLDTASMVTMGAYTQSSGQVYTQTSSYTTSSGPMITSTMPMTTSTIPLTTSSMIGATSSSGLTGSKSLVATRA